MKLYIHMTSIRMPDPLPPSNLSPRLLAITCVAGVTALRLGMKPAQTSAQPSLLKHSIAAPVRRNASLALLPFVMSVSIHFEFEQVTYMLPSRTGLKVSVIRHYL